MSRKTYTAVLPTGDTFRFSVDLEQGSSVIYYEGAVRGEYHPTSYQAANAVGRSEWGALRLALMQVGSDYYAPGDTREDDEILDEIVEAVEGITCTEEEDDVDEEDLEE